VGVLLGNFALLTGWHGFDFFHPEHSTGQMLDILARIGVVLLLFEVGLESQVHEMLSVGMSSLLVAILGVVAPMGLGWLAGRLMIPDQGWEVHAFIGATLCATSVGITARVLKDIGRSQQTEARIILGAAVIDDVLGLIVLAVVSGAIVLGEVYFWGVMGIVGKSVGFIALALVLGAIRFPRLLFKYASFLRGHGLLVATALVICFGFSYGANLVGLAPIIGAFAAGLILEGAHYRELGKRENRNLEEALAPLTALLVPIFFVEMGVQVDLESFQDPSVWGLAAVITIMAVIGKQVCALGVREKGLNKLAVGLGMIPRGEVGLIFANEGRRLVANGHPVISPGTYSAVVVMVMLTTMVTPPLLKWSMTRKATDADDQEPVDDGPNRADA
jgi:Kef-type K+ transport system membrane component KefB